MTKRFYIGKKDQADLDGTLEEWISDKIPDAPAGQKCECDKDVHAHESEPDASGNVEIVDCPNLADSHLYQINGEHVCYTFICWGCCEATASEEYLADQDYPVTGSGHAVTPRHCV